MARFGATSSLRRSFSNEPRKTLSFVNVDDSELNDDHSDLTTNVDKNKSKTEKSVHFADEESVADDDSSLNDSLHSQTSRDVISWLPSEHLYSDDTFIHDTETGSVKTVTNQHSHDQATSIPTVPSYGSSTFIDLESGDEDTDTEQIYTYTDSFVSSEVFSTSQSGSATYREWKDVTEIVKDIEDLEESEFVTRADSLELGQESDDTEANDTFDDEIAEAARQDFVADALRRLRLKELQSPRSLAVDSITSSHSLGRRCPSLSSSGTKEEKAFCMKMIQRCRQKSETKRPPANEPAPVHPLYSEANEQRDQRHPLEYYGLNSAVIERLKLSNLQHAMDKKSQDLDKDILESKTFVDNNPANEAISKEKFISQMCAHVRRENMEDTIQAHLIRMHPVTKFAEFVKGLPKPDEDVREILYEYKRQLEHRMQDGMADVT